MYARAFVDGFMIPFGQAACCALEIVEDAVDNCWRDVGRCAVPVVMGECCCHVCSGGVAHAFVQPEHFSNCVGIDDGLFGG